VSGTVPVLVLVARLDCGCRRTVSRTHRGAAELVCHACSLDRGLVPARPARPWRSGVLAVTVELVPVDPVDLTGEHYRRGRAERHPARHFLCALCGSLATGWDHCHDHDTTRGPLCLRCNSGMRAADGIDDLAPSWRDGRRPLPPAIAAYRQRCPSCSCTCVGHGACLCTAFRWDTGRRPQRAAGDVLVRRGGDWWPGRVEAWLPALPAPSWWAAVTFDRPEGGRFRGAVPAGDVWQADSTRSARPTGGPMPEQTAAADVDELADATTYAVLRGLERSGHLRAVLAEIPPDELPEVFAAEARHLDRRDARWAAESRAGRAPAVLPVGWPATFTRGRRTTAAVVLSHEPGAGEQGRDYLVRTGDGGSHVWAARVELGPA
jgi:hypothetical protein